MTLPRSRLLLSLAVLGALAAPSLVHASDNPVSSGFSHAQELRDSGALAPKLSLDQSFVAAADPEAKSVPGAESDAPVLTLAGNAVGSRIHGFGDFRINTSYITPRGLVAEPSGPQFQAVVGLVFNVYSGDGFINDISLIAGAWGDFNSHPNKNTPTGADIWCEEDFFGGFDIKFAKNWDVAYSIQAWTFPDLTDNNDEINPSTEYNMDLKVSFDDTEYLKDFALHPYIDIFWNFAGDSSPVVAQALLGKNDNTAYAELGIAPSYTYKGISDMPITFTLPAYFSMGDSSFWGETTNGQRSNLGVASVGLKISAPLKFIPQDFGNWNGYVGVTYIHTCNPALTQINSPINDSNLILGYAGIGFNF